MGLDSLEPIEPARMNLCDRDQIAANIQQIFQLGLKSLLIGFELFLCCLKLFEVFFDDCVAGNGIRRGFG
jgi:hypothetical protein